MGKAPPLFMAGPPQKLEVMTFFFAQQLFLKGIFSIEAPPLFQKAPQGGRTF